MTKKVLVLWTIVIIAIGATAAEYSYIWSNEFPNYKSQIPSSDFTTNDGSFRFTSEKAGGVTGPQFGADNKAGLLLRLYADNTLRIESLNGEKITAITFVIGGNGHYSLADLTPSVGTMNEPYLGKDATDSFKEYRFFWEGNTTDVTFTVGHECRYGTDCVDQSQTGHAGTCMTKQIILTTASEQGIEAIVTPTDRARKVMIDGVLYIVRPNGKIFNALGTEMK